MTETIDTRNVIDYFKYWHIDAIKAELDTKRHNFSILISNKFKDFNIGTVIRNCNAFLAKEVIIYGRKQFDRRGAVGTYNYENLRYVRKVDDLVFDDNCYVIGLDNMPEAKAIETYEWPKDKHVILALGQEDIGLPEEFQALCKEYLYIKQYGSIRSMNVGCASAIAMYDYCQKMI